MEMVNEINSELEIDNHQEMWVLGTELFPYEDDCETTKSYNELEAVEPVSDPYHYGEWDDQAHRRSMQHGLLIYRPLQRNQRGRILKPQSELPIQEQ